MVVASLVDSLSKIGAIGGIISFIGVGLMILLVAAQSRQIRAMREWIDAEPERQAELTQRVIAEVQRRIAAARERRAAQAQQAPGTPVPPAARASSPAPGTLGATPEARAVAAAKASDSTSSAPEAADGGSVPPPATEGASGSPVFAPLTPAGSGADAAANEASDNGAGDDLPAIDPGQETQAADALPEYEPLPAATAAAQAGDPRFADDHFALEDDYDDEEPRGNRLLFGVGAAALVAGIVIAGFVLFGGGGSDTPSVGGTDKANTEETGGSENANRPEATPSEIDPTSIRVTVLNGTKVNGLAQSITDKLSAADYTVGAPNTLTSASTVATSIVEYRSGSGNQSKARQVAKELGLDASAVQPIDATVSQAAPENSDVVVLTGSDLASEASGTTGGTNG